MRNRALSTRNTHKHHTKKNEMKTCAQLFVRTPTLKVQQPIDSIKALAQSAGKNEGNSFSS